MKKIMLSLGLMFAALTLTNCSNEIDENVNANLGGSAFELTASIDQSRIATENGVATWVAGDQINLHYAVAGATTYTDNGAFSIADEDVAAGRFTGTLGADLTDGTSYDWYALYPYSKYVSAPTGDNYYQLWTNQTVEMGSMSHLTGRNSPLYGVAKGVVAGEAVQLGMKHLGTLLKIKVANEAEDFTIQSIQFATTSQKITGSYLINYTGETPVVTMSGDNYTYEDITLTVADGGYFVEAGTDGEDCYFYAAVAPFTAPAGEVITITVNTDKGSVEIVKEITADTEFKAGVINNVNAYIDQVAETVKAYPYTETFGSDLGDFLVENVALGSLSAIWSYDSYGYAKASGYKAGDATEGWLISPVIDMTGAVKPVVIFDHAGNYFTNSTNMASDVSLFVREKGGEWSELTIPNFPAGNAWSWASSGQIDLAAYVGKQIQLGFKYTSTTSRAGTWEVKNLEVREGEATLSVANSLELENSASNGTIDIITEFAEGYTITATDDADWLTVSVTGTTLSYSADANTGNSRSAVITVTATNGTIVLTATVNVSQAAGELASGSSLPFEDNFDWATNTNNSDSSNSYSTDTVNSNYIDVSYAYAAANGGALKFGTSSKVGYITTKTLDLSSAFTVVLTAKQYSSTQNKINVVVGTQSQTVTLTDNYNDYYLYFEASGSSSSVKLTTVASTYRAYVDNLQVLSGTVEPDARIVTTTGAASNFGSDTGTTATLNGSYEVLNAGVSDVITTGFDYKLSEETDWTTVNAEATTPFSYDLTSLAVDCEYTFRAWATINGGEKVYGAEVVFTPVKLGAMVASEATLSLMFADGNKTWAKDWGSNYAARTVVFENIGSVVFANANKQTTTITDCPVTKGKTIELKMSGTNTLNSVTFNLKQWGTKAQTATLHTSTDGGSSYTKTSTTSSNFVLTATSLPEGCNAVKVTFSSGSNQVGLQNIVINYNHEG